MEVTAKNGTELKGLFTNNMHIWLTSFGRTASLQTACAAELHGTFCA
jgi:hypothetical protein